MDDTIFNYIDSVLFNKRKLNTLNEGETQFNLYMVNRWCSMYSADIAQIINETSNKKEKSSLNKQEQYEFVYNLLPSRKKKKIEYIKKIKEDKPNDNTDLKYLAKALELSERELHKYIELLNEISKQTH